MSLQPSGSEERWQIILEETQWGSREQRGAGTPGTNCELPVCFRAQGGKPATQSSGKGLHTEGGYCLQGYRTHYGMWGEKAFWTQGRLMTDLLRGLPECGWTWRIYYGIFKGITIGNRQTSGACKTRYQLKQRRRSGANYQTANLQWASDSSSWNIPYLVCMYICTLLGHLSPNKLKRKTRIGCQCC